MPMTNDEGRELCPSELLENLETLAMWMEELLTNNGSDQLSDDGGLEYRNYSEPTLEVMAYTLAHAKILHLIAAHLFLLRQDDITEEQMHHSIDAGIEKMELLNPFSEEEEE